MAFEQYLVEVFSNVGFPVVVAFYVLFRVNRTLEHLTDSVNRLCQMLS